MRYDESSKMYMVIRNKAGIKLKSTCLKPKGTFRELLSSGGKLGLIGVDAVLDTDKREETDWEVALDFTVSFIRTACERDRMLDIDALGSGTSVDGESLSSESRVGLSGVACCTRDRSSEGDPMIGVGFEAIWGDGSSFKSVASH